MVVRRPIVVLLAVVLAGAAVLLAGLGVHAKRAHDKRARFAAAAGELTRLRPPSGMSLVTGDSSCPPEPGTLCLLATADPEQAAQALVHVMSDPHAASLACGSNGQLAYCTIRGWYAGERAVAALTSHLVLPRGTPPRFSGADVRIMVVSP